MIRITVVLNLYPKMRGQLVLCAAEWQEFDFHRLKLWWHHCFYFRRTVAVNHLQVIAIHDKLEDLESGSIVVFRMVAIVPSAVLLTYCQHRLGRAVSLVSMWLAFLLKSLGGRRNCLHPNWPDLHLVDFDFDRRLVTMDASLELCSRWFDWMQVSTQLAMDDWIEELSWLSSRFQLHWKLDAKMAAQTLSLTVLQSIFDAVSHHFRKHSRFAFDDCLDLMTFSNHFRKNLMHSLRVGWTMIGSLNVAWLLLVMMLFGLYSNGQARQMAFRYDFQRQQTMRPLCGEPVASRNFEWSLRAVISPGRKRKYCNHLRFLTSHLTLLSSFLLIILIWKIKNLKQSK